MNIEKKSLNTWFLFFLILLSSIFIRVVLLDVRPLHNDEGVNHFFVSKVYKLGYYPYSHKNYHGPSFFYLLTFFRNILGDNVYALRLASALPGILILFCFIPLRRVISDKCFLLISALSAVSTTMVYISRYAIHESLFVFFTALFAISLFLYFYSFKSRYIYLALIGTAGLITTKETFIITIFSVGISFLVILAIDFYSRSLLYYNFSKSFSKKTRKDLVHFYCAFILCLFLICATFSAGFIWLDGIKELISGVPQWIGRNDSDKGHFKPYTYFISIFIGKWFAYLSDLLGFSKNLYSNRWNHNLIEPSFLLIFLLPFVVQFRNLKEFLLKKENYFLVFTSIWFFSTLFIYSWLNYKTPWCIINITLPGIILISLIAERLNKINFAFISSILILSTLSFSIYYNFIHSYQKHSRDVKNPLAYVHTQDGMLDFIKEVNKLVKNEKYKRLAVANKGYWPLPYYLKKIDLRVGYFGSKDSNVSLIKKYNLITAKKSSVIYKELVENKKWIAKEFMFNESNRVFLFVKKG